MYSNLKHFIPISVSLLFVVDLFLLLGWDTILLNADHLRCNQGFFHFLLYSDWFFLTSHETRCTYKFAFMVHK